MYKKQAEIDEKTKSCRIVIVDDDIDNPDYLLKDSIMFLKDSLMMDVRMLTDFSSLSEASQFDIIICDVDGVGRKVGLPDGIVVVQRLKELHNEKLYAVMSQEKLQMRKLNILKDVIR